MKRLFLLFLLFFLISCASTKTFYVYQNSFDNQEVAIKELYNQLKVYQTDSIPLEKWITLEVPVVGESGFIQKSIYRKETKSEYKFVYSTFINPGKINYGIKIFLTTKDKKLQKAYGQ